MIIGRSSESDPAPAEAHADRGASSWVPHCWFSAARRSCSSSSSSRGLLQFVAIFWFLSRGGMDTYMPDDIETRFSDVQGPGRGRCTGSRRTWSSSTTRSRSRAAAATCRAGILLWGPPGTGKTLMAQAVAGETAKPFVFVEPGAFINMFMGVGHPEGQGPLPEAPQARDPLRRGDRLLRRGRLAREPRVASADRWVEQRSEPVDHRRDAATASGTSPTQAATRRSSGAIAPPTRRPTAPQKEPIFMGGMGGGGMGTLQVAAVRDGRPEEASRVHEPGHPPGARA